MFWWVQISDGFTPQLLCVGLAAPITCLNEGASSIFHQGYFPPEIKSSSILASSEKPRNAAFSFGKAIVKIND